MFEDNSGFITLRLKLFARLKQWNWCNQPACDNWFKTATIHVKFIWKDVFQINLLRSVSRVASQRLSILRKSRQVFHDRSLLGWCFRGFVLPALEDCSAVWCSAADTHIKQLDRVVSGASFLTAYGVFKFDIAHRRSVAVLSVLYKIRCDPMHPLYCALPLPHVPVRVTRDAMVAHLYSYAPHTCRTSMNSKTFISLSVSLWNNLTDTVYDGVGLEDFKSRANAFLLV